MKNPVVTLTHVQKQFDNLIVEVSRLPLQKLKAALDNFSAQARALGMILPFFTREVTTASSSFNLTLALFPYWSLINYSLLEYLLLNASSEPSLHSKIAVYINDLSSLKIVQLPVLLHPDPLPFVFSTMQIKMMIEFNSDSEFFSNMTVGRLLHLMNTFVLTNGGSQFILMQAFNRELHFLVPSCMATINSWHQLTDSTRAVHTLRLINSEKTDIVISKKGNVSCFLH